jgi:hypothetical protein
MHFEHSTPLMLLLIGLIVSLVLFFIGKAKKQGISYVRRIAGIDAVDETIGRAAELGRPISFSTGITGVNPILYACLGVLSYVAKRVAYFKNRVIVPQNNPEAMAIVEDVVRDAYRSSGRSNLFNPQDIIFMSEEQFAFASGYMGMIHRENVAGAFLFGQFAAESLILAEAGQQVGAMQVGASISPEQVAFFICACDYTLIGEELFASSAYLSKEPVQLGSLYGQDYSKLIFLFIIIIGSFIATWNSIYPEANINNINYWFSLSYTEFFKLLGVVS